MKQAAVDLGLAGRRHGAPLQKHCLALLLAALVISCGGGGGGDGGSTGGSASASGSNAAVLAIAGARIEETNPAVTLSSGWTGADSRYAWSGDAAVQSSVRGATVSFNFTGTSVRWLGARGRDMGRALISVDGGPTTLVDLEVVPNNEIRTPVRTISDLSDGPHTLKIEVVTGTVVVDAFDVQPSMTVSHLQDTDPNASFSAGWTKADLGNANSFDLLWSGSGARNPPELAVTAQETSTQNETATLPFRGVGIAWIGYRGPDGGIATVQVDGGAPTEVDTYAPTARYQAEMFKVTGLADANHTLTITATGRRNDASSSTRVVVDAWDVMNLGRRYEEYDPSITKSVAPAGATVPHWNRNPNRVWTEGNSATSNQTGATLTFSFTGTSVSWIGCEKSSAGGSANVYIDGVLMTEVHLGRRYPIEGYQMTVFRQDGLAPGPHTLMIEITTRNGGPYVVVDAFDVRP